MSTFFLSDEYLLTPKTNSANSNGPDQNWDPIWDVETSVDGQGWTAELRIPFSQIRSNLVIRWEYIPGSTLYLVWSQGRTGFEPRGDFSFGRDVDNLFEIHPHNVFLVKFSYCFQL
ncbi:MAG: hypothetical protein WCB96_00375 [Candidatus Aminicenantales bacterium]